MVLSDKMAYRQVIGCLMKNPLLLVQYTDIDPTDFDVKVARICFIVINNLFKLGAAKLTPIEVDQEIGKHANSSIIYEQEHGLDFLKTSYEFAELENFEFYYNRLKKYSLLRRLQKEKYDISEFYIPDNEINNPLIGIKVQERCDQATLEEILNSVESKYNLIRNDYLHGGRAKGDPSENIFELIEDLRKSPSIGPSLEGKIFSSACRGARRGCFFLKSASTNSGKTRTSVFDACHIAYPERWSYQHHTFAKEINVDGTERMPRKVLFIVTEMDKEEIQTIMLAYLSGVNEDHILTGKYELGELSRVRYAASIIKKYSGFFLIEEISDPNLTNVEATIRKYATIDKVEYVFHDYIHTTASVMGHFASSGLREDVVLMLMANQLKQLAKDYNLFIFSATQVNSSAMIDDGEFKNETCIRGAKSIADKADVGIVMTRVTDKLWNSLIPTFRSAAREGIILNETLDKINSNRPTHILDIYKMRRGRYKNVRIWSRIDLGNGERNDLFITTADNQPIREIFDLFSSAKEQLVLNWSNTI